MSCTLGTLCLLMLPMLLYHLKDTVYLYLCWRHLNSYRTLDSLMQSLLFLFKKIAWTRSQKQPCRQPSLTLSYQQNSTHSCLLKLVYLDDYLFASGDQDVASYLLQGAPYLFMSTTLLAIKSVVMGLPGVEQGCRLRPLKTELLIIWWRDGRRMAGVMFVP